MIHSLKRQKFVDGRDGFGILAGDDHFPASGQISRRISDVFSQPLHYAGSGNFSSRMDEAGQRKVSATECIRDGPHVSPNGCLSLWIGLLRLENHASAIGQRLENVLRGVLVDTHRCLAALLKGRER